MANKQDDKPRGEIVEMSETPMAQIAGAEIMQQISTAKAYPRNITTFQETLMKWATRSEEVAQSCIYTLKRQGADGKEKSIVGPSVRFAEIACTLYQNLRSDTRIIGELEGRFVVAQSTFYDLENNIGIRFEAMRRITTKTGKKYGDDMIVVTSNAAASIAFRNAITKAIPRAWWWDAYEAAEALAKGDMKSLPERRLKMLQKFLSIGVESPQVYGRLGVKGIEDITLDHIVEMIGIFNTIRQGEISVAEEFAVENWPEQAGGPMTPEAPQRSEFRAPETAKPSDAAKPAGTGKPADASKNVINDPNVVVNETPNEQQSEPEVDDAKATREKEYAAWFEDMKSQLVAHDGLQALSKFYDAAMKNIIGDDRMREFTALYDKRHREILDSTRKPSSRGK